MSEETGFDGGVLLNQGTRVVLVDDVGATTGQPSFCQGSVGMIIKVPEDAGHSYRVSFPDGGVGTFRRNQLCSLAAWKEHSGKSPLLVDYQLKDHVIFKCIVGSRAFGLDHDASDVDIRGIYLPPAQLHWSLWGVPEQLEDKENEECFWELQKFLKLALKANPNILECLYTPLIEYKNHIADELLSIRSVFLSKLAYQTYSGYVVSQFKKMEGRRQKTGEVNWKHAMHLIRLLYAGTWIMTHGEVLVDVGEYRQQLLSIRHGQMDWESLENLRLKLLASFENAYATTSLPERPDYDRVNRFLLSARLAMVNNGG